MFRNALWIFALAFLILVMFLPSFSRMQDIKAKNAEYQTRIGELEKENKRLMREKRLLENDPEYTEKVAREKMGLVREGEVIYRLVPENVEK